MEQKLLAKKLIRIPLFGRILIMIVAIMMHKSILSQDMSNSKAKRIGTVEQFRDQLTMQNGRMGRERLIETSETYIAVSINHQRTAEDETNIIGEVSGYPSSNFYLTFKGALVEGNIVIPMQRKAFKYFSDAEGSVYVSETDIHEVLCVEMQGDDGGLYDNALPAPPVGSSIYDLESFPGSLAVVLLDFDGEYVSGSRWNGGNPIDAAPSRFTESQILSIWHLISEDFRPFNINITTNEAVFLQAPRTRRTRVIFTPTTTAAPGTGGVAYVNSFSSTRDDPCWVFNSGVKSAAEAGSHEIGHTLGLRHDGRTSPREDYYRGHGNWGPIMGSSYNRSLVQWSRGEYANANNTEDDLSIIARSANGFGYRADEAGNTLATAADLVVETDGTVLRSENFGVITTSTDIDVYAFQTSGGLLNLTVRPADIDPNLDIKLRLTDDQEQELSVANPSNSLLASLSLTLSPGRYFLHIEGTGNGSGPSTGYSDYGSVGAYTISGSVPTDDNQPPTVNILSPEPHQHFRAPADIFINIDATDADGHIAKVEVFNEETKLIEMSAPPFTYTWHNVLPGIYEIEVIATDNKGASSSSVVEVVVSAPVFEQDDCSELQAYQVEDWQVFNDWSDQNFGSQISQSDGTMLITHRRWGREQLWLAFTRSRFVLEEDASYEINLDLRTSLSDPVASIDLAFTDDLSGNSLYLLQPSVNMTGTIDTAYSKVHAVYTANASASGYLLFRLNWNSRLRNSSQMQVRQIELCGLEKQQILTNRQIKGSAPAKLMAFPNAFNEDVTIRFGFSDGFPIKVMVSDITGKVIYTTELISNQSELVIGKAWPKGIYLLHATSAESTASIQLMKE